MSRAARPKLWHVLAVVAAEALVMMLARGGGPEEKPSRFWVGFVVVNGLFAWTLAGLKLADRLQARWVRQGVTPDDLAVGCFAAFVILSIPLVLGLIVAAVLHALS